MQNVSLNIILPATYIPWDMAPLLIWITSGSCFALIHPDTNDVPPSPSRSCPSAIHVDDSVSYVYLFPGSFRLVFAQVRKPMESFLISDESRSAAISYESSRGLFLNRLYFRPVLPRRSFFFLLPYARSAMIHGRLFLTEAALFETGK